MQNRLGQPTVFIQDLNKSTLPFLTFLIKQKVSKYSSITWANWEHPGVLNLGLTYILFFSFFLFGPSINAFLWNVIHIIILQIDTHFSIEMKAFQKG